jgi:hypothetical protein
MKSFRTVLLVAGVLLSHLALTFGFAAAAPRTAATSSASSRSAPSAARATLPARSIGRPSEPLNIIKESPPAAEVLKSLPPPLSREEVIRIKRGFTTTTVTVTPGAGLFPPVTALVSSSVSAPKPGLVRPAGVSPASASAPFARLKTPTPAPVRILPDRLKMVGGSELPCRILEQRTSGVRVEIESGVILEIPTRRIQQLMRKAAAP